MALFPSIWLILDYYFDCLWWLLCLFTNFLMEIMQTTKKNDSIRRKNMNSTWENQIVKWETFNFPLISHREGQKSNSLISPHVLVSHRIQTTQLKQIFFVVSIIPFVETINVIIFPLQSLCIKNFVTRSMERRKANRNFAFL